MDELKLGPSSIKAIVELLAKPLLNTVEVVVHQTLAEQEKKQDVLDKKQLAKEVFGQASSDIVDKYMYMDGFPTMPKTNEKQQTRFSRKAVEKWISENQIYYH